MAKAPKTKAPVKKAPAATAPAPTAPTVPPKPQNAYLIFIDDSSIDDTSLASVEKKIGNAEADNLYLIIQTYGGSPFAAVAIMNILQAKFKKITTIVPRYAKSAGTLMALGTDEIYMQERSALGPLDLPIEHHRDGSRISALDVVNTTTSMAALVEDIANTRYAFLRKGSKEISKLDAAKLGLESANEFLKPIMNKVDPYHLQKAHRELRIGRWYAIDMLSERMMKGRIDAAQRAAQRLVFDFPAHEYSIYSSDAEFMLGLNVKKMKDLPAWKDTLESKYNAVCGKEYYVEFGTM